MKNFVLIILLFLMLYSDNYSQQITGTVTSSVTQTGTAGVKVIIRNNDTGTQDSTFTNSSGDWSYNFSSTGYKEINIPPEKFSVAQNYPNPFNPSTTIDFSISVSGTIQIFVHNILGELIDFRESFLNAGNYSIEWNSKSSAGIYFYTIRSDDFSITKKMVQLDGGNGIGFGKFFKGKKALNRSLIKTQATDATIVFYKLGFSTDTIKSQIMGGEHFNTLLIPVHEKALVVDLHNDILEVMASDTAYHLNERHNYNHTDIPRLKDGGMDIQWFSVWVSPSQFPDSQYYQQARVMVDIFNDEIGSNPDDLAHALDPVEALDIVSEEKIACVIGVEGGHAIENSIEKLTNLYNAGMRYLTITWNNSTDWAVSAQDPRSSTEGLSEFGKDVIRTMDSLGIIIDVSHTGIKTIEDILEITTNPIIASHSCVRSLRNHYRNLYDEQIIAIANTGGVIGVTFYPPFLSDGPASINTVIQHIDYIVNLVGIDYVAIGSDFDGIGTNVPSGLGDVSKFPSLTRELLQHGYSEDDVYKIIGGNFMRVFQQVCSQSAAISKLHY